MIDAAELLYRRSFRETIDKIMNGEPISIEHRATQPSRSRFLGLVGETGGGEIVQRHGGRGLYEGNHVQRSFADLQALQGHIVAGWEMPAYSYGQVMLGGQPSDSFT